MSADVRTLAISAYAAPDSRNGSCEPFLEAVGLYHRGSYGEASGLLEDLLSTTDERGIEHLEILRLLAFCSQARGDLAGAERQAHRIQKLAQEQDRLVWQGHALVQLSAVSRDRGHAAYGANLSIRAIQILKDCGDLIGLSRACYELGYCLLQQGDLAAARQELEAATKLASMSSDPLTEALASRRLGFCHVQQNEFAFARVAYERALRVFQGMECEWRAGQVAYGLAVLEICYGDLGAARRYVDSWDNVYEQSRSELRIARWRLLKGWLLVVEDRAKPALESLERARSVFEANGAQRDVALSWEFIGDANGLLGKDEAALLAYEQSISWGRRVSAAADVVLESMRKSGEVLARLGKNSDALLTIRRALPLTRVYSEPMEKAALLRLRGIVKVQRGRIEHGISILEDAWKLFSKVEAGLEAQNTAAVLEHFCQIEKRPEEALNWKRRKGIVPGGARLLLPRSGAQPQAIKPHPRTEIARAALALGIASQDQRTIKAFEVTLKAAPLDLPILILGETGTGKELFANLAHARSGRKGSLLAINCAALPADILDAELFGHTKGAYTGAYRDRPGLIEAANDGTLFLDEIGEMTLAVQGRLLRAIEAKEIRRLGENRPRSVSTRFVGATHRDLNQMVKEGSFRADLFFRLKGVIVKLPPLRERPGDVVLLADHFLSQAALRMGRSFELGSDAREKLSDHPWPGNVRELRSVIERAAAMCAPGEPITAEDLDIDWTSVGSTLEEHLEAEERRNILAVLESVDWNQAMAARRLKTKRTTLLGKLKRLGIERPAKKK